MENLQPKHSLLLHLEAYEYAGIWREAYPPVGDLAARIDNRVGRIKGQMDVLRLARLSFRTAAALERYRDKVLDGKIADLAREVLVLCGGDRESSTYKLIFPQPPSDAMRPVGGQDQSNFVKMVVNRLENEPAYRVLKPRAKAIIEAQKNLEQATAQKNERKQKLLEVRAEITVFKAETAKEYRLFHPELQLKFPDEPDLVDMFFMALTRDKKAIDAEEGEDTPEPGE